MRSPDNTGLDNLPAGSPPTSLPPAPWILLDRTTATQAATVLDRLEQWLAGAAAPDAAASVAAACSLEQDDAFSVAAWLGALASRLENRIAEADSWS
jgi:hypothetical protein